MAFRAKGARDDPGAIPTLPGRFHETVRFHETEAAAKAVRGVRAHFHAAERFRAAVAKTDARCAKARIRVLAADRTGAVVRRAKAIHYAKADQRGLAFHCATDDPCFGWALGSNVVSQPHETALRAMDCCDPLENDLHRSNAAPGRESVRPVDNLSNAMACRYE